MTIDEAIKDLEQLAKQVGYQTPINFSVEAWNEDPNQYEVKEIRFQCNAATFIVGN